MKYSIGDCLSEHGFRLYEKLHEPIFLVSKLGRIVKINESGRKLINIARLSRIELEERLSKHLIELSDLVTARNTTIMTGTRRLHLTTSKLTDSDYFLIEVKAGR